MRRRADIDARDGRLLVSSWSATEGAYPAYVQDDWVDAMDEASKDTDVGRLVRSALAASRDGVPYPDFRNDPEPGRRRRRLFKLAGVKSEAQYERGLRKCGIDWDDAGPDMTITPYRNGGRRTGFTEMLDQAITVDVSTDDAGVGAAVRRALAVATDGI